MERQLWRRWLLVPAVSLLGALGGLIVALAGPGEHRAEAAVLVSSPAGVSAVRQALPNVLALAQGSVLAANVDSTLRLEGSAEDVRRRLHASMRPSSQVIVLSVSDPDGDRARQIAQEAAIVLTRLVSARFGTATPALTASVLDPAHVLSPTERRTLRDMLVGAGIGLVLALAALSAVGTRERLPADIRGAERDLAKREGVLQQRLDLVAARERALARRAGQLAQRREEPVAPPPPPPAAAPAPEPPARAAPVEAAAEPIRLAADDAFNVEELQRVVAARRADFPERADEWEAYVFSLRQHAGADGRLPAQFSPLVAEVFEPLLR